MIAKLLVRELKNARRRYRRAAERYEKQAAKATGAERRQLQQAARSTRSLASQMTVKGLTGKRQTSQLSAGQLREFEERAKTNIRASYRQLAGNQQTDIEAKNVQAANILASSSTKRSTFYGAFKNVWLKQEQEGASPKTRDERILTFLQSKGYKVDSLLDAVKLLDSRTNVDFFADKDVAEEERYGASLRQGLLYVSQLANR